MADLFQREDSHFLVFFDADKTVQLLPRQKIVFSVGDNVSVSFPTSTLKDDGTEDIQDIPYAGKVFFSGSASKCRGLKTRINEEVNPSSNSDYLETIQKLAKEVKSCGKRGASVKLKRAIEEESRDTSKKKNKKQKKNDESSKNASSGKEKAPSKLSSAKALKLKEMMAFAGVLSEYPSDSLLQTRAGSSPSKCLGTDDHLHNHTGSPQKSSTPPLIVNIAADNTDTPTTVIHQSSPTKQKTPVNKSDLCRNSESPQHPKKASTSINLPAETTDNPPRTIPRKSPRKQSTAASVNKSDLCRNSESPQHPKEASTSINLPAETTDNPPRTIPRKSPRKQSTAASVNKSDLCRNSESPQHPKEASTSINLPAETTDNPPRTIPRKSPRKQSTAASVNKSDLCRNSESPQHPKEASTSINLPAETTDNPPRTIPRKSPRKQSTAASVNKSDLCRNSESPQHPKEASTSINLPAETTDNPPRTIPRKSPRKQSTAASVNNLDPHQNSKSPHSQKKTSTSINLQADTTTSETATSSLVSSSLNLINSVAEDSEGVQFDEELTDFADAYYSPEYGYNVESRMLETSDCRPSPPFQGLINYYNQLDHNAQVTVFGFLNVLVTELQGVTYGHSSSDSSSTLVNAQQQSLNFQQQPTGESDQRKIPLLRDDHGTYDDILVNPSRLRQAESKALVAKSPAAYLLNKVLDLIFTEQELAASKGVRSLDAHKMEAVNEYIHAWTTKMNVENVNAKSQTSLIQNKIGNLRFHRKKKAGAVLVSK